MTESLNPNVATSGRSPHSCAKSMTSSYTLTEKTERHVVEYANASAGAKNDYTAFQARAVLQPFYRDFLSAGRYFCPSAYKEAEAVVLRGIRKNPLALSPYLNDEAKLKQFIGLFLKAWRDAYLQSRIVDYPVAYDCTTKTGVVVDANADTNYWVVAGITIKKDAALTTALVTTSLLGASVVVWQTNKKLLRKIS